MAGCCFAFAPNEGYIYISPTTHKRAGLLSTVEDHLATKQCDKLLWAAFGPGRGNMLITCVKGGRTTLVYGDDVPPELLEFVNENMHSVDDQTRFTLGSDNSFFAWTKSSMRWQNIPKGLEKTVQSWLGPQGWTKGPPRIVSIGADGSYFALSEYGTWSYSISPIHKHACKAIAELKRKNDGGTLNFKDLEVFSLSSCDAEMFACLYQDCAKYKAWVSNASLEHFYAVLESAMDPAKARNWRLQRMRSGQAAEARRKTEEAKKKRAEQERLERERRARAKTAEEERRKQKLDEEAEDLALKFDLWATAWEDDILRKKAFTTFPHLPVSVCVCADVSCQADKTQDGSLRACRHDAERFFRASGLYDYAWLKKERVNWHPDQFGKRCDPDFRKELTRKAEQLYQIFEQLLAQERGTDDDFASSP